MREIFPYQNYNPNYFTQYPQYNFQQIGTIGKVVENIEAVRTTDIPYQGVYYFPAADGSAIYTKQWLDNGQTRILTFKPCFDNEGINSTGENKKALVEEIRGIAERINSIEVKLDEFVGKKTTIKSKKEGVNE